VNNALPKSHIKIWAEGYFRGYQESLWIAPRKNEGVSTPKGEGRGGGNEKDASVLQTD